MPTYARRQIVIEDTVGVYHCIARYVRRAFLCGTDPYTGQDYSHRKEWILDRLRELAGLFSVEVCVYSVMSNHLHHHHDALSLEERARLTRSGHAPAPSRRGEPATLSRQAPAKTRPSPRDALSQAASRPPERMRRSIAPIDQIVGV